MLKQFWKEYLKNLRLKSSSISYALFAVVLIGILMLSLVMIVSYNNILFTKYWSQVDLIDKAKSIVDYSVENYNKFEGKQSTFEELEEFNDALVKKGKWGMLDMLQYKVFENKDTIRETLFLSPKVEDKTALTLINNQKHFSLAGNSIIEGDVKVPFKIIKQLNLSNTFINKFTHKGWLKESVNELPSIKKNRINTNFINVDLDYVNSNDFFNSTKLIELTVSKKLEGVKIKGNYVVDCKSKLEINKTVVLEDVIIKGEEVDIFEGFSGSLQIFATKKVVIGKNVRLKYPSVIYVHGDDELEIQVGEGSEISGGVILNSKDNHSSKIKVSKGAVINGDLYCKGVLEFEGVMNGAVYSNEFYLNTGESEYKNAAMNLKLNKLPVFFDRINFFSNVNNKCFIIKRKK